MGVRTEQVTRLALSERVKIAVSATLERYAAEIDTDDAVRAVRIDVKITPRREVRAVIVQRESEFSER